MQFSMLFCGEGVSHARLVMFEVVVPRIPFCPLSRITMTLCDGDPGFIDIWIGSRLASRSRRG